MNSWSTLEMAAALCIVSGLPALADPFTDEITKQLNSLEELERKSTVLCVRGTVAVNYSKTVSHNLAKGGSDATWALKINAVESAYMAQLADYAGWTELKNYYDIEAQNTSKLIRGEFNIDAYKAASKTNERPLANALAPEMARQDYHSANFIKLKTVCDSIAKSIIGMAKIRASN